MTELLDRADETPTGASGYRRPPANTLVVDVDDVAGVLDFLLGGSNAGGRPPVVVVIDRTSIGRARVPEGSAPRLAVDVGACQVRVDGRLAPLSPLEWEVLRVLASRPGTVVGRREIIERVWPEEPDGKEGNLDNALFRLRRKLEVDPSRPRHLVAVRSKGLVLELADR